MQLIANLATLFILFTLKENKRTAPFLLDRIMNDIALEF